MYKMSENTFEELQVKATQLDREDHLNAFKEQFFIPKKANGEDEIYFCGNSLGLQPKITHQIVNDELEKWQTLGVKGHFSGEFPWMPYHEFLADGLAQLVGAKPEEVVAMNSLTTNLHLMMVSFFNPKGKRSKILIEKNAFPSDFIAVQSQLKFHGLDPDTHLLTIQGQNTSPILSIEDWQNILEQYGDEIALVIIPGVQYQTGQLMDISSITQLAKQKGCRVGVDLAHAIGNVPLKLHNWGVDFAVWCHYKYLNSGPGAVGGCFAHEKHHQDPNIQRFAGWWGHEKSSRFLMKSEFKPIPTAESWQLSNPPIFSLAAIRASLLVFEKAGWMGPLREKSIKLTGFLQECLASLVGEEVDVITPLEIHQRGSQLSLKVNSPSKSGKQVFDSLMEQGITIDWREPNVIRVAPVPLYNCFKDVLHFVKTLRESF